MTGGSGLVGSALQAVVAADASEAAATWIFLAKKDGDLTDAQQTAALFAAHKPTHVVHLAAQVGGLFANMSANLDFFRSNLRMCVPCACACRAAPRSVRAARFLDTRARFASVVSRAIRAQRAASDARVRAARNDNVLQCCVAHRACPMRSRTHPHAAFARRCTPLTRRPASRREARLLPVYLHFPGQDELPNHGAHGPRRPAARQQRRVRVRQTHAGGAVPPVSATARRGLRDGRAHKRLRAARQLFSHGSARPARAHAPLPAGAPSGRAARRGRHRRASAPVHVRAFCFVLAAATPSICVG